MKRLLVLVTASLLIAAIGGASVSDAQSAPSGSTVSIAHFAFAQPDLSVPAGTTVTWTNADGVQHTASSVDGVWDSGALSTNDSFTYLFNQAGDFAYQCAIHPDMHGTVHVLGA